MELGAFSISLAVADIDASRRFYEHFGFKVIGGDRDANWQILRNGDHTIGLFEGMFEENILTFNPGWDRFGQELDSFADVRQIQHRLKDAGVDLVSEVDPEGSGPGSLMAIDPDGNPILIDQHR
ncbi:MAG: VOC family protein [Chloroflexi bacterium]|nr:VOC family protein [Chloroflexota bacterium]